MNRRGFLAALAGAAAAPKLPAAPPLAGLDATSWPTCVPLSIYWLGSDGLYVFPTVEMSREECRRRWPATPLPPRKLSRTVTIRRIPDDPERVLVEEVWR